MKLDLDATELEIIAQRVAELIGDKLEALATSHDGPEFLTIGGAAELLGLPRHTVYDATRAGELKAGRYGKSWRIERRELLAWGRRRAEKARKDQ